jgi:ADP-ribosylglycohydrolase
MAWRARCIGAVSLGGDTDTIASIAGQVMGAAGIEPPPTLLKTVIGMQVVEKAVSRFIEQIAGLTTPG